MSTRASTRAFITGVSGPALTAAEREFIGSERPWGFILFKRNIETPAQVILLVRELREAIGNPEAPVLIDQEGGRVQRLGPPHWPVYPPGAVFGVLYDTDPALGLTAARLSARLMATDLIELGVTVDCLPLADVPVAGADAVIGNRAYGTEPGKGGGHRTRRDGRSGAGRHIAGAQAYSRAWAGHRRHSFQASGGRYIKNGAGTDRFRRVSTACGPADGNDRTCCV